MYSSGRCRNQDVAAGSEGARASGPSLRTQWRSPRCAGSEGRAHLGKVHDGGAATAGTAAGRRRDVDGDDHHDDGLCLGRRRGAQTHASGAITSGTLACRPYPRPTALLSTPGQTTPLRHLTCSAAELLSGISITGRDRPVRRECGKPRRPPPLSPHATSATTTPRHARRAVRHGHTHTETDSRHPSAAPRRRPRLGQDASSWCNEWVGADVLGSRAEVRGPAEVPDRAAP